MTASRLLLAAVLSTVTLSAEDWPQFRGPTGQGHSSERGVPVAWSETSNIVWKTRVPGNGWSSPVVAGGKVWLTTTEPSKARGGRGGLSLRALAFDAVSGTGLVDVEVFRIGSPARRSPRWRSRTVRSSSERIRTSIASPRRTDRVRRPASRLPLSRLVSYDEALSEECIDASTSSRGGGGGSCGGVAS